MVGEAQIRYLKDGRRLHMQHGPIDIIAEAFGSDEEVCNAYAQGEAAFSNVLADLVSVLPHLQENLGAKPSVILNGVAAEMGKACLPFAKEHFVTPMAAVAGAVADHVLDAMIKDRSLRKLYVNNGGDIALYLAPGESLRAGIVNNQDAPALDAGIEVGSSDAVGGMATSGWRGRSLSPGIADAVTVLASTAAGADVAATLIAGAVKIDSPAIEQEPASNLRDDTDLGEMLVTTGVGPLSEEEIELALSSGYALARSFQQRGLIQSAYLSLQGTTRVLKQLTHHQNWRTA
ncbi:MAG: UPF0280 family protein [Proteobacteria bacterium]|nr:UPF0280 family protein [Pseudomonadota bacterium]